MNDKTTQLTYALLMSLGALVVVGSVGVVTGSLRIGKPQSFAATTAGLQVVKYGDATDVVTASPAGISCGAGCYAYPLNTFVTLTATPGAGHYFYGWAGCDQAVTSSTNGTCSLTIYTASQSVNARFGQTLAAPYCGNALCELGEAASCQRDCVARPRVDLKANGIDGSVTVSPGSSATLGWTTSFVDPNRGDKCVASGNWSGNKAVSGSESTGSLTNTNNNYALICNNPGGSSSDSVSVTASIGTMVAPIVTLTANDTSILYINPGEPVILKWSSAPSSGTSCTAAVTLGVGTWSGTKPASGSEVLGNVNQDGKYALKCTNSLFTSAGSGYASVIVKGPKKLTVQKAGVGSGTVTSTSIVNQSTQINCGATCSVTYPYKTYVTLTATPAVGSYLTSWSGCEPYNPYGTARSNSPQCQVTMSNASTVTVTFSKP